MVSQNRKGHHIKWHPFLLYFKAFSALQLNFDFFDRRTERLACFHLVFDRFTGMQNGGMIFLSDNLSAQFHAFWNASE